ncbi:hypothetical protein CRM22_010447 [Opisthorchis felineus]|uniref:Egal-1 winged helix domain-containing protein n=2 Tax=Opisthorchis felineus TaxID=147828 RepID=A0A4S2KYJ0_OPIFE|nr:hypothetical protein CRM22_010447 [Opisthorchis felineus]
MVDVEHASDSELDDPKKITDAASCLDYLKRREVFLYKMMNDPSHKAMLYFLEVLMNSEAPMTVEQLAARFTHKSFSPEMREACGGGSPEGLRDFLLRYPSLFNVRENGQVTSVAIELPGLEGLSDGLNDVELYMGSNPHCASGTNESVTSGNQEAYLDGSLKSGHKAIGFKGLCRPRFFNKPTEATMGKFKGKSSSSLSLISTPSNASSSSGSMMSFNRPGLGDRSEREACNGNFVKSSNPGMVRRGSNPSIPAWSKPGIYQPPHLREQKNTACETFLAKSQCCCTVDTSSVSTTCVHCPLLNLACHHHCPISHHHTTTHCLCATARLNATTHCHHCISALSSTPINNRIAPSTTSVCALPPMEKLVLETEAVRFFQQRLLKREERWVPIKSLAGHLSQATPEVRAVVGPQLEFRNFLLRHPHVFEVQGELVSVKDPLGNIFPQRKPRDRLAAIHTSLSSTNLSITGLGTLSSQPTNLRNTGRERVQRPKSLILPNAAQLLPTPFIAPSFAGTGSRRNVENRRSTHFAENFVTACYFPPNQSASTSSAPNTPTGVNGVQPTNPQPPQIPRSSPAKASQRSEPTQVSNSPIQSAVCSSTESDPAMKQADILQTPTTMKSISISMSANEYRAIMFLRKVLEKKNGAPGQPGLALTALMQLVSAKSIEPVQSTIGWTIVELEEFINQHPIFFELLTASQTESNATATTQTYGVTDNPDRLVKTSVRNKRLERMINIVITGTKPTEPNVRTLTNRCGRIFHVAKLWGIIDLGKHEHVFFDKSIFKHVDDLQKYFKVDEILYFNAILAPKESRAKWRATQVWKECDRENFEKFGGPATSSRATAAKGEVGTVDSVAQTGNLAFHKGRSFTSASTDFSQANDNEDTEADEEIEDIEMDPTSHSERYATKPVRSESANDSDCDFVLNGEEDLDDEEPYISTLARQDGLHLSNDVRFIADDGLQQNVARLNGYESGKSLHGRACQTTGSPEHLTSYAESEKRNNFVSSSTEQASSECASLQNSRVCSSGLSFKEESATSTSSSGSSAISIAVQTVSTGEIMATQLYHDAARLARIATQIEST